MAEKIKQERTLARNLTELAEALDIDVAVLKRLRQEYPHQTPQATRQGRHSVQEWRTWLDEGGLEMVQSVAGGDESDMAKLKCRETLISCKLKELAYAERSGMLSDPTDTIQDFGMACAAIMTGMGNMKAKLKTKLVGLDHPSEVEAIIDAEFEILVNGLRRFTFPDEEVGEDE